jgi:pimeloyl-ACP methyl ester carboxylesterase
MPATSIWTTLIRRIDDERSESSVANTGSIEMTTTWTAAAHGIHSYAEVNGLNLYYEIHQPTRSTTALPLVLLHGGLGSGEMFGPILPQLTEERQVIAVDLQGHGRTADIDRPLDVRLMADDIAALIRRLEIKQADVLGYSLGGGVALFVAANHHELVHKLILVSANTRSDAIYPEMRLQQGQVNAAAADFMKETPMYQLYQRVAPRPEDFGRLLEKIGASMAQPYDYDEVVRSLKVPTMITCADADMAPPSHYADVFKLLDGGLRDGGWMAEGRPKGGHALAILPGLTHYSIFASPLLADVANAFLDDPRA